MLPDGESEFLADVGVPDGDSEMHVDGRDFGDAPSFKAGRLAAPRNSANDHGDANIGT